MAGLSRIAVAALALAAATAIAGCDTSDGRSADAALLVTPELSELTDSTWVADAIVDPDRDLVPGSTISMTFTDDSLSVNAGCNTLGGPASVDDDGELVVAELATTLKACEDPLSDQDAWLTSFLTSRPTIERQDDEDLWLTKDETVIHLVADPDSD
jgi:heat shock protein HslJ